MQARTQTYTHTPSDKAHHLHPHLCGHSPAAAVINVSVIQVPASGGCGQDLQARLRGLTLADGGWVMSAPALLPGGKRAGRGGGGRRGDLARPPSSGAGRKVTAQPGVINKTRSSASPDAVINIGGHQVAGRPTRPQLRTQPGVWVISSRTNIVKVRLPVSASEVSYQLDRIYSPQRLWLNTDPGKWVSLRGESWWMGNVSTSLGDKHDI